MKILNPREATDTEIPLDQALQLAAQSGGRWFGLKFDGDYELRCYISDEGKVLNVVTMHDGYPYKKHTPYSLMSCLEEMHKAGLR